MLAHRVCLRVRCCIALLTLIASAMHGAPAQSPTIVAPPAHDAMAFLARARAARMRQDTALAAYIANATQRLSLSVGLTRLMPERLAFRHENAARITWHRGAPVQVTLRGARSFIGAWSGNFSRATDRDLADAVAIPYFPAREQLWSGDGMLTDFVGQAAPAKDSIDPRALIHPLAAGAERWYRYALGDSAQIILPGDRRITLRELRITAVAPRWNLIVGSFWFDDTTADLVRAAYRLAEPTNMYAVTRDQPKGRRVPRWLGALVGPLQYEITAIVVEFALVGERFWLPRLQALDGVAMAGGIRASMRIEQRFSYEQVASTPTGATGDVSGRTATPSVDSSARIVRAVRYGGAVMVHTVVPRDRTALAHAPELPASLFDDGEGAFSTPSRAELLRALRMDLQPATAARAPSWQFGVPLTRYNRIEGLSTGVRANMTVGGGLSAIALLRASIADRQANGELALERSNGRLVHRAAAFRRLATSNDWGAPLSPAASLGALLFGSDEGAYYRTSGVEIGADAPGRLLVAWRLFAERQTQADVRTRWSMMGHASRTLQNPAADPATLFGGALRLQRTRAAAPTAWRTSAALRVETAAGRADVDSAHTIGSADPRRFAYARALLDATVSHGIGGPFVTALSTSLGITAGDVPSQRLFALGGVQSIRGQRALAARGDALWMARGELAWAQRVVRPSVFADIGWSGARSAWRAPGRPLSSVGVGMSVFDGLVRADLARGVHPSRALRATLSLDARF